MKTKRVRASKSTWINSNLKQEMHKRDVLKIKAIRSKEPSDWANFKKHRNYVNGQIKRAKVTYHHNAIRVNEGDIRNTWRAMNEVTSRRTVNFLIKEIKINGASITDARNLADTFNSHFSTIGADLANETPSRNNLSNLDYITKSNNTFELNTTNYSEVFCLLT